MAYRYAPAGLEEVRMLNELRGPLQKHSQPKRGAGRYVTCMYAEKHLSVKAIGP